MVRKVHKEDVRLLFANGARVKAVHLCAQVLRQGLPELGLLPKPEVVNYSVASVSTRDVPPIQAHPMVVKPRTIIVILHFFA